jgi:hypothetical protein
MFTIEWTGSEPYESRVSPPLTTPRGSRAADVTSEACSRLRQADADSSAPATAHPIERPIDTPCLSAEDETRCGGIVNVTRPDADAASHDTTFDALSRWRHGFESRCGPGPGVDGE